MKIEQVRQVMEIYKTGSVNKAAQRLFTSQPCVSSSLKALERELSQKIFLRSPAGMVLTDFGQVFVKHAVQLLKYADEIEACARSSVKGKSPLQFSVSVYYLLFAYVAFRNFMERYQNSSTNFRYHQVCISDVAADVRDQETELGMVAIPTILQEKWRAAFEVDDLSFERIYTSRPAAMLARSHPVFSSPEGELTAKQLQSYPLVLIRERHPLFDQINKKMCQLLGAENVVEANDRTTAHEFIENGRAYACVVHCGGAYEKVDFFQYAKILPICDLPFQFELGWLTRKDSRRSPIALEYMADVSLLLEGYAGSSKKLPQGCTE